MNSIKERTVNVDSQISICHNKLIKKRNKIPLGIVIGIVFSFIFPYIPGRHGRKPMLEDFGYENSVVFCVVFYAIIYLIGYATDKSKLEKELRELKFKKYLIEEDKSKCKI
ncbi:MAG: hypothetical protein HRT66_07905 [Flavobacteriaceae bacterium]|nr:hypothetical protein [Flavobacteriaceae bacterium]